MGEVAWLGRYPVKSMRGESLVRGEVGPAGLAGDRRAAVVVAAEVGADDEMSAWARPPGQAHRDATGDRHDRAGDPGDRGHRRRGGGAGVGCRCATRDLPRPQPAAPGHDRQPRGATGPERAVDARRVRPNLVIRTEEGRGFVEDDIGRDVCLGVYATVVSPGTIRPGDPVELA